MTIDELLHKARERAEGRGEPPTLEDLYAECERNLAEAEGRDARFDAAMIEGIVKRIQAAHAAMAPPDDPADGCLGGES